MIDAPRTGPPGRVMSPEMRSRARPSGRCPRPCAPGRRRARSISRRTCWSRRSTTSGTDWAGRPRRARQPRAVGHENRARCAIEQIGSKGRRVPRLGADRGRGRQSAAKHRDRHAHAVLARRESGDEIFAAYLRLSFPIRRAWVVGDASCTTAPTTGLPRLSTTRPAMLAPCYAWSVMSRRAPSATSSTRCSPPGPRAP